ncbi:hypothetical protein Q5H91_03595 [Sphingomonas sp. KR1UV-12]|uniref:Uncharacterized protein n=1 Tax=Sphingomonas aurea TaxID=3063994 RepID=A0ABT9EH99_9SPHN|nr:hypothetical protein [Sphingomonas sp. KR1UV-12]MDP1026284.1 hypothetical protein [Sphingomonas sp. KR1UV-12]
MSAAPLNRRALIGGAGIAAVALATPLVAGAAPATPQPSRFASLIRANEAAVHRFNTLPEYLETRDRAAFEAEEERMHEAYRLAAYASPTTWPEFACWIEHVSDGGHSAIDDEDVERLLAHTRRLAKLEG